MVVVVVSSFVVVVLVVVVTGGVVCYPTVAGYDMAGEASDGVLPT